MAQQHNSSGSPYIPTEERRRLLQGSTTICLVGSWGVWVVLRLRDSELEVGHSDGEHTSHPPDCVNSVPVLLT
jgi:hypothetical protein